MSSRIDILEKIRQNKPESKSRPESFNIWASLREEQRVALFKENLTKAGADVVKFDDAREIMQYISENFGELLDARNSEVKKIFSEIVSNEKFMDLGVVILHGQFGVAENGAIWVDDSDFPHRLFPFAANQLIILLQKKQIVNSMHEAYRRINLKETGFGVFISGPSKTADIEQCLVYGAHGAKAVIVLLLHR